MEATLTSVGMSLGLVFILLAAGVNIGVSLGVAGVVGAALFTGNWGVGLSIPVIQTMSATSTYSFVVIPLFILLGELAFELGLARDLFNAAYRWIGRLPGGVAITTIAACGGLAAISGSSVATTTAMSRLALPELRRYNYDLGLSVGAVAVGATVAIMIPPSLTLVLYGVFAEQPVGKLLIAGIVPGVVNLIGYGILVLGRCVLNPSLGPPGPKFSWREKFAALPGILPTTTIFLMIILGILLGIWTPVESAAVGVIAVLVVGILQRRFDLQRVAQAFVNSAVTSTSVMLVVAGSMIFSSFLALSGFNRIIVEAVTSWNPSSLQLFLLLVVVYFILGMFMEATSILALTVPLVMPVITAIGWNPIWFGVFLVWMMEVAAVTPPVGLNLYALKATVPEVPLSTIITGAVPFWLVDVALIVLLFLFPAMALFLPGLM